MKRVVTFLLAAGIVFASAAPALAAPPSGDPRTDAKAAAAWLASKVSTSGFIPQTSNAANADLSSSAQAVTSLVAAGVGKTKVTALLGYLGTHVDDLVKPNGIDDPGALAYLILAAKAGGADPTSFGSASVDLVTRLVATQQPKGLFGVADATHDGATREGLALLALHAVGTTNPAGVSWLESQQCADGSFNAFRIDTSVPCPAIDPNTFTGSDTNSTAFAIIGLASQGDTAAAASGVSELKAVRNAGGGWGFLSLSSQATDANSTGVVLEALRTATGSVDTQGRAALLALQVGCTGPTADQGGIAFQPGVNGVLVPNVFATVQSVPALTGAALPIEAGAITDGVPAPCPAATTTTAPTTSTTVSTAGSTVTTAALAESTDSSSVAATAATELPRTGSSSAPMAFVATTLLAVGALVVAGARRRRA